ncbi:MAG: M13 family metallopeptidase [Alphaproteobacteria bacterium]|nr:M13 family metallopeptidase [Alphaproteobacteria bacterium]
MQSILNRRALLIGACAVALAAFAFAPQLTQHNATAAGAKPLIGTWGVDLAAMDKSIKPGDDFFRHTGGTWMKTTQIPPDRSRWGSFNMLAAKSEEDVRAAVEDAAKTKPRAGTVERKAVDYYQSYIDTKAIEARGLDPVKDDLARIAAAATHEDLIKIVARPDVRANLPVGMGVTLDQKRPNVYIVSVGQAGLGMPDRDYYLKQDAKFADTRAKYRLYVETLLKLAGYADPAKNADAIVAVEQKVAELHWPREKSRNRDLTYNPKSRADLKTFAPDFPWDAGLEAYGIPQQNEFIVVQLDAVQGLARLFRETPIETWRAYLTFHYLNAHADILPKAFDDASFEFNGKVVTGQLEQRDRWKRAVSQMSGTPFNAAMGEAVGQLYVKRNFSPAAKAAMSDLVENLRAAYKVRIAKLPWMSEETKKAALRKLETINVKIGYPNKWRDYSSLEIKADDAFGNRKRENAFQRARDLVRLAKGADRNDWGMAPQTVNAYYSSVWNEIVFPAAILQPPFFDLNADPSVNYGGIGAVIGHEMGHGFDDQGAKSDEMGVLRKWWNEEDERRFKVLGDNLADQYSKFEALPGLFVNGRLTLGENIGDLGGLNVSLEAYKISLKGKDAPLVDGYTGTQRFFLGFGQIWRQLIRDDALRNQVVSDSHSPGEFRANGTVRNMDEWYEAFDVKESDKLYLAPDKRVRIW